MPISRDVCSHYLHPQRIACVGHGCRYQRVGEAVLQVPTYLAIGQEPSVDRCIVHLAVHRRREVVVETFENQLQGRCFRKSAVFTSSCRQLEGTGVEGRLRTHRCCHYLLVS